MGTAFRITPRAGGALTGPFRAVAPSADPQADRSTGRNAPSARIAPARGLRRATGVGAGISSPFRAYGTIGRMTIVPPSVFGTPALRSEDPRFLRGEGRYLENIDVPGSLRAVFVRSIFPHAVLKGIEGLDDARSQRGVVSVFTAADLDIAPQPPAGNVEAPGGELALPFFREALARDRLRFVGEPYAVVIAETLAEAEDAAEGIWAEAEEVPVVIDPEVAMGEDAPLLWPEIGTNVAHSFEHAWDEEPLAGAEV